MTEKPRPPVVQVLTAPHNSPELYEDDFDYSQHTPIELPVGPWDCIDRACEQYEAPDGSDLPDVTYCSHVTVLLLCSACSGASASANHAIKYEIAWDDCILKHQRRRASAPERQVGRSAAVAAPWAA
ncbi:hypothetical protein ABZS79_31620 [Streptomyces griseoloalbus]|uniref:hypothetical protein n=1 Tax=Streptomyces griseoloalbus TaxID=67303 RepID=UPI0033A36FEC